jgi:hypothetical protein
LNTLNIAAAAAADEAVMPHPFRIESRGAALDGRFTHQTRLHQVPQIVMGPAGSRWPETSAACGPEFVV